MSYKQVKAMRDAPSGRDVSRLCEDLYEAHLIMDAQLELIVGLQAEVNPKVYNSTEANFDHWVKPKQRHFIGEEWK